MYYFTICLYILIVIICLKTQEVTSSPDEEACDANDCMSSDMLTGPEYEVSPDLGIVSEEDLCFNQPCENPQWDQGTCCEGFICIEPELYESEVTPRCVPEDAKVFSFWSQEQ